LFHRALQATAASGTIVVDATRVARAMARATDELLSSLRESVATQVKPPHPQCYASTRHPLLHSPHPLLLPAATQLLREAAELSASLSAGESSTEPLILAAAVAEQAGAPAVAGGGGAELGFGGAELGFGAATVTEADAGLDEFAALVSRDTVLREARAAPSIWATSDSGPSVTASRRRPPVFPHAHPRAGVAQAYGKSLLPRLCELSDLRISLARNSTAVAEASRNESIGTAAVAAAAHKARAVRNTLEAVEEAVSAAEEAMRRFEATLVSHAAYIQRTMQALPKPQASAHPAETRSIVSAVCTRCLRSAHCSCRPDFACPVQFHRRHAPSLRQ